MSGSEPPVSEAVLSPLSYLLRSALVWPTRPATRFGDATTTYAELLELTERFAGGLQAAGVGAGDRVAVLAPNVPEMLAAHFAVPGVGAVLVPLNTRLGPSECRFILEHAGCAVLVVHPSLRALAETAVAAMDAPARVLVLGAAGTSDRAWLDDAVSQPLALPDDERALLSINYTSGTTGDPKGAMYSHRGAYLHTLGVIAEAGLTTRSAYLWTLPMFHCNGWAFTWAATAAGATHVCMNGFDTANVWALLRTEGVTHLCGAPTVLTMLDESDAAVTLDTEVRAFVGGAPPAPSLLKRIEARGLRVTHLYGLTETYGPLVVCAWQPDWDGDSPERQAVLRARQGVGTVVTQPLRVVNERMEDVPADGETLGEVVMRGNNVMLGYYRNPDATARAFAGGWFHSGDLGVMHRDGYVELRDRAKDIVISGGENISTIELEQAICAHDSVVEAAVVGVPDERWGEVPKAYVVLRPGTRLSPEQVQDFVRGRLARYKVPRLVEFCEDLPRTATGKVQKYLLR